MFAQAGPSLTYQARAAVFELRSETSFTVSQHDSSQHVSVGSNFISQVPLQPKSDPTWRSVRCHDWKGDAIDEGNEVAEWLSKFLQQRVRLVKYGGQQPTQHCCAAPFATSRITGLPTVPQQARLPDKARRTDLNALSSQHAEVACPQKLCKLTAKNVLRRLFNLEAYSSAGGSVQATVNSYQNVAGVPGSAGLDEDSHRRSSAKGWYTGGQSETAFSDAFPFLVTCQVSHCNPL